MYYFGNEAIELLEGSADTLIGDFLDSYEFYTTNELDDLREYVVEQVKRFFLTYWMTNEILKKTPLIPFFRTDTKRQGCSDHPYWQHPQSGEYWFHGLFRLHICSMDRRFLVSVLPNDESSWPAKWAHSAVRFGHHMPKVNGGFGLSHQGDPSADVDLLWH